jgi:large subunit ribosomal protein L15
MKPHELKPPAGAHRPRTRKGRGEASGKGKTTGRGTKGTGARGKVPAGFEGGQIPLQRRLPKLPGFTPRNRVEYHTVNVGRLEEAYAEGDEVTPASLRAKGLVRSGSAPVKVLGTGEVSVTLTVHAHAFSASARSKIESSGGSATVLPLRESAGE